MTPRRTNATASTALNQSTTEEANIALSQDKQYPNRFGPFTSKIRLRAIDGRRLACIPTAREISRHYRKNGMGTEKVLEDVRTISRNMEQGELDSGDEYLLRQYLSVKKENFEKTKELKGKGREQAVTAERDSGSQNGYWNGEEEEDAAGEGDEEFAEVILHRDDGRICFGSVQLSMG
ncbi:hypothetical protein CC80DRAFT_503216 [Byssothecium circinans]|uniref:Uncharacterized protein n=1 Tax=Byssothecium circinans TaxID=147558 RepID=A0A6A5U3C6_9PLEO|nr:hypothetical protein CC80DRAFT_503216 [Byssothecium circinans]